MKNSLLILLFLFIVLSCSDNTTQQVILIDNVFNADITGTVNYTNETEANKNKIGIDDREWILSEHNSELEIKVSKNLTSNPYNLKLTIYIDKNNPEAPVLNFISDFDRKITAGDRFRLITSIILQGSTSFIPGTTGGQIFYNSTIDPYGFGFGSEFPEFSRTRECVETTADARIFQKDPADMVSSSFARLFPHKYTFQTPTKELRTL